MLPPQNTCTITLISRRQLSPSMVRLTFHGKVGDFPIRHGRNVKLMMPCLPGQGDGVVKRIYTIRHLNADAGTIDIDFVLHEPDGPASHFARHAAPGDSLQMIGPKGALTLPAGLPVFIAGDASALPAIGALLESLPADATGTALIHVPLPADEQALSCPPGVRLVWLHGGDTDILYRQAASSPVDDWRDAFIWVAAESGLVRRLRDHYARHGRPGRHHTRIMGYWKAGQSETEYHEERHREMDED
ncbi:siderophore-interacting protein [Paludibacterium paludis]|uniref:FAD-binding FR-type domain-containing protein n=1 Tax=Paludibacterium paludis TaxID=1225769 RepID=A0A918UB78_9NEIS|nr:siderophore-interacting protein [Paludibacterium paludis]GGY22716.1 hypothetical protein GCM10011289_28260 [Paludibacterium paludis]